MKLAASTLGCPEWSLEEVIRNLSSYGYQGVEIRGIAGETQISKLADFSPTKIEQTRRRFEEAGLEVACLSISSRFSSSEPAKRQENVDLALSHIPIARALGLSLIRIFGGNIPEGANRKECVASVRESLKILAEPAEKGGVTFVLETHDSFILSEDILEVIEPVAGPGIGVLWDVLHPFRLGEPIEQTAQSLGPYVRHIHIKDAKLHKEKHTLTLLGEGDVPLQEAVNLLKGMGYEGWLSFEWEKRWHPELPAPEVAFPHAIKFMRRLIAS
jgi:sugar phosphate isomerase/epimerase